MEAVDWGRLIGQVLILILIAYAILAIFLIKPLRKYRKIGAGIAIAIAALLTYQIGQVSGNPAMPWLGWLIATAFVIWRVSREPKAASPVAPIKEPEATPAPRPMQRLGRGAVWIAAFVVAFFAVKHVKQAWFDQRAIEKVSLELDQMGANAAKARPDLPPSQARQEAAVEQSTAKLASQAGDKQAETAADMYWGFLFVNTRARVAFCRNLGVDISSFATAFENLHAVETAKARAIYRRLSAVTEDQVYEKLKAQMNKTIADDMEGVAKANNVSATAICQVFSQEGEALAKEMLLSRMQPALHEALRSAK